MREVLKEKETEDGRLLGHVNYHTYNNRLSVSVLKTDLLTELTLEYITSRIYVLLRCIIPDSHGIELSLLVNRPPLEDQRCVPEDT